MARQRSPSSTAEDWRSVFARGRNGGNDIITIARKNDSYRNLPVVGAIGCVEGAAAVIKAYFAAHMAVEGFCQRGAIDSIGFCGTGEFAELIYHERRQSLELLPLTCLPLTLAI